MYCRSDPIAPHNDRTAVVSADRYVLQPRIYTRAMYQPHTRIPRLESPPTRRHHRVQCPIATSAGLLVPSGDYEDGNGGEKERERSLGPGAIRVSPFSKCGRRRATNTMRFPVGPAAPRLCIPRLCINREMQ